MTRWLTFCLIFLLGVSIVSAKDLEDVHYSAGFYAPAFSWTDFDTDTASSKGINGLLGYTSKHFHEPLKVGEWNSYWHWGSVFVIVPYVGIGTEYISKSGFYFDLNTIFIIPTFSFGYYF